MVFISGSPQPLNDEYVALQDDEEVGVESALLNEDFSGSGGAPGADFAQKVNLGLTKTRISAESVGRFE